MEDRENYFQHSDVLKEVMKVIVTSTFEKDKQFKPSQAGLALFSNSIIGLELALSSIKTVLKICSVSVKASETKYQRHSDANNFFQC